VDAGLFLKIKEKSERKNACLKFDASFHGSFKPRMYNARKVNCSCVYSAYILKPVFSGRNLYPRRLKALNFDNFDNSHNNFL